jgi:hypothetical protein
LGSRTGFFCIAGAQQNSLPFRDRNEAEEIMRRLQKDDPGEFDRIKNLPNGIRFPFFLAVVYLSIVFKMMHRLRNR